MLSISPIYEGDQRRGVRDYLDKVANSRDDYYTGRGEAPGVWAGRGAAALNEPTVLRVSSFPHVRRAEAKVLSVKCSRRSLPMQTATGMLATDGQADPSADR